MEPQPVSSPFSRSFESPAREFASFNSGINGDRTHTISKLVHNPLVVFSFPCYPILYVRSRVCAGRDPVVDWSWGSPFCGDSSPYTRHFRRDKTLGIMLTRFISLVYCFHLIVYMLSRDSGALPVFDFSIILCVHGVPARLQPVISFGCVPFTRI